MHVPLQTAPAELQVCGNPFRCAYGCAPPSSKLYSCSDGQTLQDVHNMHAHSESARETHTHTHTHLRGHTHTHKHTFVDTHTHAHTQRKSGPCCMCPRQRVCAVHSWNIAWTATGTRCGAAQRGCRPVQAHVAADAAGGACGAGVTHGLCCTRHPPPHGAVAAASP